MTTNHTNYWTRRLSRRAVLRGAGAAAGLGALALILSLAVAACSGSAGPGQPAPEASQAIPPPSSRTDADVTYCYGGAQELKMDVRYPDAAAARPAPAVLWLPATGNKGEPPRDWNPNQELVRRGYVVVSLSFRPWKDNPFPASIEDVKCAVRHLRANAATYGIDSDRIGAWGGSNAGALVALLALAGPEAGLEGKGGYEGVSSRVAAVVDFFGVSDWWDPALGPARMFYGLDAEPLAGQASPVTYVSAGAPPFLIIQGDKDTAVPLAQSQLLHDRLRAAGLQSELVVVANAQHALAPVGGPISPTAAQIAAMVADFFDRYLRRE